MLLGFFLCKGRRHEAAVGCSSLGAAPLALLAVKLVSSGAASYQNVCGTPCGKTDTVCCCSSNKSQRQQEPLEKD